MSNAITILNALSIVLDVILIALSVFWIWYILKGKKK